MKALVLRKHGTLDELQVVSDYPVPQAIEGHVVIRVRASSFNYHDVFTVKGMPGIKVPLPVVIGLDIALLVGESVPLRPPLAHRMGPVGFRQAVDVHRAEIELLEPREQRWRRRRRRHGHRHRTFEAVSVTPALPAFTSESDRSIDPSAPVAKLSPLEP